MDKEITLSDIGRRLGVSTVTVSKALSGQKGVSEETRRKVRELASEMGYKKPERGREKSGRKTIGVAVAERYLEETESFYWRLNQELSQCAIREGCFSLLEVIDLETERRTEIPKLLTEERADGLILLGAFSSPYLRRVTADAEIPVICMDAVYGAEVCDSVVSDNLMGGYQMVNYLFGLGHRRIGFVGTRLATTSIDHRYLGYIKSLMEHGVEPNPVWLLNDRDRETGKLDAERFFELPKSDMPTAFFCNCDRTAGMLIKKLRADGWRVPEDVSVVGFDNYLADVSSGEMVTTYETNIAELAKKTVHIITRKIERPELNYGTVIVGGRFVERGSAAAVGRPVPFI